jgi:antirestriction protein
MTTPSIYIADLSAYNNGRLHGVWVDATDGLNEISDQVKAMLKASPEPMAEEYAIHDYEGFGSYKVSEYEGLEEVHGIAVFIEEHGALGAEVLDYACGDMEQAEKSLTESYNGEYKSVADFSEQLTEDTSSVPEHLQYYIDYEKMGRDMELSGDIFTIETGFEEVHIFWNH